MLFSTFLPQPREKRGWKATVIMCLFPKIWLFQSRSAFPAGSRLHPIGMMERGEGGKVELEGQALGRNTVG